MNRIHPTALVDPGARLGVNVSVGPYTVIDGGVEIGDDTVIGSHNVITGLTRIGRGNRIYHFASIGEANQDKKYKGEPTRTQIGDRNTIHEFCTIHRGTVQDEGVTRIGSDNWFMAYSHEAHDCRIGDNTVFANNASLAGHVHVGDWVVLGGFVGVHQFVKIGEHAMIGATSTVLQDVPPFVLVGGNPLATHGVNSVGLKRRGFDAEAIAQIKRAYKTLYRSGLGLAEAKAELDRQAVEASVIRPFVDFLAKSERGLLR
jgi:UDP-N-acetylglucosamine acyltransferase